MVLMSFLHDSIVACASIFVAFPLGRFRGVNIIRESIHSVFLHSAILESGMDMGPSDTGMR